MADFIFTDHSLSIEYPESSQTFQFGKGYRFVSKPEAPDQVIFDLKFNGLWWFRNANGDLDASIEPSRNMLVLQQFYEARRLYTKFTYDYMGSTVNVRFYQPLTIPHAELGQNGLVKDLNIKLILEP